MTDFPAVILLSLVLIEIAGISMFKKSGLGFKGRVIMALPFYCWFLSVIVDSKGDLGAYICRCILREACKNWPSVPSFGLWFFSGFFFAFLIFPCLPKITLPYHGTLENSLLPSEVSRCVARDYLGDRWAKMFEAKNYQLNSSALAAWIKIILARGPPCWEILDRLHTIFFLYGRFSHPIISCLITYGNKWTIRA